MAFSKEELKQFEDLLGRKFDEKLPRYFTEFRSQLIVEFGEMLEQQILPQLHEAKETADHHQRVLVATKKALATA